MGAILILLKFSCIVFTRWAEMCQWSGELCFLFFYYDLIVSCGSLLVTSGRLILPLSFLSVCNLAELITVFCFVATGCSYRGMDAATTLLAVI